jgi:hypothetical protein
MLLRTGVPCCVLDGPSASSQADSGQKEDLGIGRGAVVGALVMSYG